MPRIILDLNAREKAICFVWYTLNKIYPPVALLGLIIVFVALFKELPDRGAFFAPIIGIVAATLDIRIFFHFLTTKTQAYTEGFEWYTMSNPYKHFYPFSLYQKKVRLLSTEWLRAYFARVKSLLLYGTYKLVILAALITINFSVAKRSEAGLFNFGLSLFFWCSIFLLLWKGTYMKKAARLLGIADDRMKELREAMIQKMGRD